MPIKASQTIDGFIQGEEGFSPKAYPDAKTGKLAVGFGVQTTDPNARVSRGQADMDRRKRIRQAEEELSKNITRSDLSQGKMDVLVDMHYNMGLGNMKSFIDVVNSGDDERAALEILKYTKAYNEDTGRKEDLDVLKKRVNKRHKMWNNSAPESRQGENEDLLSQAMEEAKGSEFETNDLLADAMTEATEMMAEDNNPTRMNAGLDMAANTASSEILVKNQEARRLSEETGMSFEDAQAELAERPAKDILADQKKNLVAEYYPGNARWAQDPDNYQLMRDTGDWSRRVEVAARPLNKEKRGDWSKAIDNNRVMLKEALNYLNMTLGAVDLERGKKTMLEIDNERRSNQLTGVDAKRLETVIADPKASLWDKIKAAAKDPVAAIQLSLQSQGSTIATIGASLGGAAAGTAAGGPAVGVGAGAVSAYSVSHLLSYSEYMTKQLEQFRDPRTGIIDIDKAYSDPARVKAWVKEADIYGLTMGVSDAVFSLIGGKLGEGVAKSVFKAPAKTVGGKVARKATEIGATTIGKSAEEGGSQTAALSAVDLYKGELTPEKFDANVAEGSSEAVLSAFGAGAMTTVGAGVKYVTDKPQRAAAKTAKIIDDAKLANDDVANISELRARVASNEASRNNPEQTKDLVDESLILPPIPEDMDAPASDDIDGMAKGESQTVDMEAETDSVAVSPAEWFKHHELNNADAIQALQAFGPTIQQAFARNRGSDTSVVIPVSDWLRATQEDPALDGIARINGNEFNAVEANELIEELEKDPYALFEKNPESDVQMDGDDSDIQIIEATGPEGNLISRPVELINRFRAEDDRVVFDSVLSRLKKSNKEFDPKALEIFAEMQMRHMRSRADMLGKPISEIGKRLQIGKTTKRESNMAHGIFKPNRVADGPYTVVFSPTANMKTVVHEFGHAWLHEMSEDWEHISGIPEDGLSDQQREYRTAMETAADLLNIENMSQLYDGGEEMMRRRHERFAQTTELYFLEGKFENSRIRSLMDTFRQWFTAIASTIAQTYKQYPAFKITPEVERMFEAVLNISNKVEEEVTPMFPVPLFDPEMLGPDGVKYRETILDARSQAIGKAYAKSFNKSLREREKMIDTEITRIQDEATDQVDQMPSMVMRKSFEDAFKEYKADPEGDLPDPRLNFESIVRTLTGGDEARAEELRKSAPSFMIAGKKKGGMDVAQFMQIAEISDPAIMFNLIVEAGLRNELIEQKADEIIAKDFPAAKTDEEIHRIAVDAVNADGKAKLLLAEIKILATKYLPTLKALIEKAITPAEYVAKATKEKLEVAGTDLVRDSLAFKFNANKFLRDSTRHGRQAARLFRTGNILESFDAKYREALHYFAFKAAQGAQEEVAKTRARVKQFVKYSRSKDLSNTFDADVMAFGRQVIQAVGSGEEIPEFNTFGFSHYSGITDGQIDVVNHALKIYTQEARGKAGNDLTVGGYVAFGEVLKKLMTVAKDAKKVEIDGRKTSYQAAALDTVKGISKSEDVVDFTGNTAGSQLRRSFVTVRALFESLYESEEAFVASPLGKLFYGIVDAEAKNNIEYSKYNDRMVKAVRNAVGQDSGMKAILDPVLKRVPFISKDKYNKPIIAPELGKDGFTFKSKAELHMANLLVLGSESGAKKFLLGYDLSFMDPETKQLDTSKYEAMIKRLIADGTLTKKDFDMYQEIWNMYEEIHPLVKDAMRRSDGFNMGKINGRSFTNSFGSYTGGYVPVSAKEGLQIGPINSLLDPESQGYRAADLYPSMNTGMTNERNLKHYPVDLDMSRLSMNLRAALNIAYLRSPMMDFGKVISDPGVSAAIEARRPGAIGSEDAGVIVRWFKAVKGQEYTEYSDDFHQELAKKFRQNTNMALYFVNLMSPVKQFFGLAPALAKVSLPYLSKAAALQMAQPRKIREDIRSLSVMMDNRLNDSQEQMIRSWDRLETNFDWVNWTEEKIRHFQYFFIQTTQNMVDVTVWKGAYDKAMNKGMSETDAVHYADGVVETTQSSPSVTSMANIQRGQDIWKLVTMVSSVPLSMHNMGQAEMMRDQTAWNKTKAVAMLGLVAVLAPTIMEHVLSEVTDFSPEDEDKDEEKKMEEAQTALILRTITGSMDTVLPLYSRPVSSAILYGASSISPAFSKLSKVSSSMNAVKHKVQGVDLTTSEMAALMDTLTIVSGVPFSVVGKAQKLGDSLGDPDEIAEDSEVRREQLAAIREGEE